MTRYLVSSVLAFALLLMASAPVEAQVKPFKISGVGIGPEGVPLPGQPAREHWAVGAATQLGLYYGEGTIQTESADFSGLPSTITGLFGSGSPFTFVGANGDKLVCDYGRDAFGDSTGEFELTVVGSVNGQPVVTALFIAEFVPISAKCTGKFKGVTGSWIMYAETLPFVLGSSDPVYYVWEGNGKLKFAK